MITGRLADVQVPGLQEGLPDLIGDGGALSLCGLWGGARALVVAEVARALRRPLVVVSTTLREAEELTADLRFFLDRDRVHLFPEPEAAPFQPVSPPLAATSPPTRAMEPPCPSIPPESSLPSRWSRCSRSAAIGRSPKLRR